MNKIVLVGRLTKDVELKELQNDKKVAEFSIAVNRYGSENADFINCQVWDKQAENLAKYTSKGSQIAIEGSLRVDKYEKDGENRYKTYVIANSIDYISNKKENNTNGNTQEDPFEQFK